MSVAVVASDNQVTVELRTSVERLGVDVVDTPDLATRAVFVVVGSTEGLDTVAQAVDAWACPVITFGPEHAVDLAADAVRLGSAGYVSLPVDDVKVAAVLARLDDADVRDEVTVVSGRTAPSDTERATGAPGVDEPDAVDVLVIDDDGLVVEVTASLLRHFGARVTDAASRREACDVLARQSFDVIICDTRTGQGDVGESALLEAVERFVPRTLLVFTSGLPRSVPEGAMFLAKPYHDTDLQSLVERARSR